MVKMEKEEGEEKKEEEQKQEKKRERKGEGKRKGGKGKGERERRCGHRAQQKAGHGVLPGNTGVERECGKSWE